MGDNQWEDGGGGGDSNWMSRLPEELLDVPLWNLAIPGSHDSMSFCLDLSSPVLGSEPFLLRLTDRLLPCWVRPCVYRWSTTQQSVLWYQCELGVRFLDLRIAKKPAGGSTLFFAHGIYTLVTVTYSNAVFLLLIQSGSIKTLADVFPPWHGDKITLDYQHLAAPFLPKSLGCSRYADSPDPNKVISYLEEQQRHGRPDGFYVSGLNLTEDILYVLLHPLENLRKMTTKGLSPLLHWTAKQRPGPGGGGVNIVCCDFVSVSRFCSIVISLNFKLLESAIRTPSVTQLPPVLSPELDLLG
ncbi:PREDICTED: PI-PLC X domain-containing protein 1-like [Cyprinodon variegatus]|uniref:PI-PLC X domain-containing protein 1-like n=1 Tax=Cyprinodon variegatus TaxID=28743 RepID=UPI00074285D3|nr:PREDICTED: PI-PLC X domain-containing protein 1-like [Cyprinodon variegatus]